MKRCITIIFMAIFLLLPLSGSGADDILSHEERAWLNQHGTIKVGMGLVELDGFPLDTLYTIVSQMGHEKRKEPE